MTQSKAGWPMIDSGQKETLLWMDEILHHFETMGHHCLLVFVGGIILPGFLRWCRTSLIHSRTLCQLNLPAWPYAPYLLLGSDPRTGCVAFRSGWVGEPEPPKRGGEEVPPSQGIHVVHGRLLIFVLFVFWGGLKGNLRGLPVLTHNPLEVCLVFRAPPSVTTPG